MNEKLQNMREKLIDYTQSELEKNIDEICCAELSNAIDMIKDLSESLYYCEKIEKMQAEIEAMNITPTTTTK